jgi:hypothetical protein
MKNRVLLTIAILTALGLAPAWASAQVKITTPGPTPEPRIVTPGLLYEKTSETSTIWAFRRASP